MEYIKSLSIKVQIATNKNVYEQAFEEVDSAQKFLEEKIAEINGVGELRKTIITLQNEINALKSKPIISAKDSDIEKIKAEAILQGKKVAISFMNNSYDMAKVANWKTKTEELLKLPVE